MPCIMPAMHARAMISEALPPSCVVVDLDPMQSSDNFDDDDDNDDDDDDEDEKPKKKNKKQPKVAPGGGPKGPNGEECK